MHKICTHKSLYPVLLGILLLISALCIGQEQEALDTIVVSNAAKEGEIKFNRITDVTPVVSRTIPDSVVNEIKKDEDYWYANKAPERQKYEAPKSESKGGYSAQVTQNFLWYFILAIFAVIFIWFLASSNISLFRKRPGSIDEGGVEGATENFFAVPYDREIDKAINEQNYRLAIRFWYLKTLKELSNRGLIQYAEEFTNSQYLSQVYNTPYYKNFFRLTRDFEYVWYGKFEISYDRFMLLQNDFLTFKQLLH